MRHSFSIAAAGLLLSLGALTSCGPSIPTPDGYELVWQEEFDGNEVNQDRWTFENWKKGRVNHELQYYVSDGELGGQRTATVKDGTLSIIAQKYEGNEKFKDEDIKGEVISARMNTNDTWQYGYMEARIKLPKGKGTWPAFWMMPTDRTGGWPKCGEIDIMEEVGYDPDVIVTTIHTKSYNHTIGTQKTATKHVENAEGGWHVYALEWTPDYLQFYVDGEAEGFLHYDNDKQGNLDTWPFDKPYYITLNLAWGGDWGGSKGIDESALPITMEVDYVRVFQKKAQ